MRMGEHVVIYGAQQIKSRFCLTCVALVLVLIQLRLWQYQSCRMDPNRNDMIAKEESRICSTGNDFLNVSKGGRWFPSPHWLSPPSNLYSMNHNYACFHKGYRESYVWRPPCIPWRQPLGIARIPKVLLLGDSLSSQIYSSCTIATGQAADKFDSCTWNGIEYTLEFLRILYIDSIPYQSRDELSQSCAHAILSNGTNLHPLLGDIPYNERHIVDMVEGYDLVIFNQFAWWNILAHRLQPCYTNDTLAMKEFIDFYRSQLDRFAQLMVSTKARIYYRTASPHAFPWVTEEKLPEAPLLDVPPAFNVSTCIGPERGGDKLHKCADTMNEVAVEAFVQHGHSTLDSAPALNLRIDSHPCSFLPDDGSTRSIDCLHYCVPGPTSVVLEAIETEVYSQLDAR